MQRLLGTVSAMESRDGRRDHDGLPNQGEHGLLQHGEGGLDHHGEHGLEQPGPHGLLPTLFIHDLDEVVL